MPYRLLGRGIYSFSEAAMLTRVHPNCVRAWFGGVRGKQARFMESDYHRERIGSNIISFLDLIELLVVGRLRGRGLSLQYLRKARAHLAELLGTSHPLSHKKLYTSGRQLFLEIIGEVGEPDLIEVGRFQYAIPRVLAPYLQQVEYDAETDLACRWNIFQGIVIDPQLKFGKPVLAGHRIPTAIVVAGYGANKGRAKAVADWYGITAREVHRAVRFERHLGQAVA